MEDEIVDRARLHMSLSRPHPLEAKVKELEIMLSAAERQFKLKQDDWMIECKKVDELEEKLTRFIEHHEKMCHDYTDRLNAQAEKLAEAERRNAQMLYDGLNGLKALEDWYRSGGRFMSSSQYADLTSKIKAAKGAL